MGRLGLSVLGLCIKRFLSGLAIDPLSFQLGVTFLTSDTEYLSVVQDIKYLPLTCTGIP